MGEHLDTRMITALAKEIWIPIQQWLYGKAGEPRYSSCNQRALISGNDQNTGLRFKNNHIIHTNLAIIRARKSRKPLGRKGFDMRVSWNHMSKKRMSYYQSNTENIKQTRLVLDKEKIDCLFIWFLIVRFTVPKKA